MPNQTGQYHQLNWDFPQDPTQWKVYQENLNYILRQMWNQLDGLSGRRGTTKHEGDIDAGGNTITNIGSGVTGFLRVGTGFRANASGQHAGVVETITLGAAITTFRISSQSIVVTGDAGTNTIATITGGLAGQFLALLFVDALVTITDDNTHATDSVDLSAAFTSADDTILLLFYDGTSWYEVSRSVN